MSEGNMADGSYAVEVKPSPASSISPVPATSISPVPANSPEKSESVDLGVDLYTQAVKTLSERSPFDSSEVLANTSSSLPSVLARLLVKPSDSRRKRKRNQNDTKSSWNSSEKSSIWFEFEEYFKELTLQDIERLYRLSLSFSSVENSSSCFSMPELGNFVGNKDNVDDIPAEEVVPIENDCVLVSETVEFTRQSIEKKVEDEDSYSVSVIEQASVPLSLTEPCSSMEWVLGSRNRVFVTSKRPTKKRKLLGENAGLEILMVTQPYEGSSSLCHVCSIGDTRDQLNKLVFCSSCKVVVHQKCYGIQGDVNESWLCSFCKHKSGHSFSSHRPCVLCPKSGGASKCFQRAGREGVVEFAHLFCGQWMPDVYVGDTRMMEPLLCVEGMKDVRGKLVCSLCKVKFGSCVRCSDGSCRTSFHPICAREAKNKLEIWGKFGCDDIELRAFCAKHSADRTVVGLNTLKKNQLGIDVGSDQLALSAQQGSKIKKLKIGWKNGDKVICSAGVEDSTTIHSEDHVSQEVTPKDINSNTELKSGSGDLQDFGEGDSPGQKFFQGIASYIDLGEALKKLLVREKVSLQQIASEIDTSEDSLATKLSGNLLGPEMSCKILKWLRDHAYMDTSKKDSRTKAGRLLHLKAELGSDDHSDAVAIVDWDMPDVVPVKSVPPRRRTIVNVVKEGKVMLLCNDEPIIKGTDQEQVNGVHDCLSDDTIAASREKIMVETNEFVHPLGEPSPVSECILLESINPSDIECNGAEVVTSPGKSSVVDLDQELPCSISTIGYCEGDLKSEADSFVHPYIQKKLEEGQCLLVQKACPQCGTEVESSVTDKPPTGNISTNNDIEEAYGRCGEILLDLRTAEEMRILDLSPENELEGEIIFSQQLLLHNAVALKHHADKLVCKVVKSLPYEMDAVRKKRWDDVLVNQYIYELNEARKQSRKERRHKEAQAVLAAATEAAAASSRVSLMRKNSFNVSSQQESRLKVESSRIRGRPPLLPVTRPNEFNSSFDVPDAMSEQYADMFQYNSRSPKENLKSCDICRRAESSLNPVLVCLSCKVAVHLNCYRSVKESTGPWYCELCEELSLSKASRNTIEKPNPIAECGLCGGSNGAFRKSSSGQWVHAFCAEWVLDSTFRRGQVFPVAGLEKLLKANDICSVCNRRFGVCIKCNYGSCRATYHPSCAKSAGYYMIIKYVGGGKMQRRAYCSKHSLEQKAKAETRKYGLEDLKIVKQQRVELEKLRLLCERIVKREKLKREFVLCNHDVLASRRNSMAVSMLARRPLWAQDGSSESATTSLGTHSRPWSEAMQKSDDVTIDSALSSTLCIRLPLSVHNDQKTDDSSTSQRISTPKPMKTSSFAGKQIPVRGKMTDPNFSQSREKGLKP